MPVSTDFEVPEFPPHIDDVTLAFPANLSWPCESSLPVAYRGETTRGCQVANTIFALGWEGALERISSLYAGGVSLAGPPPYLRGGRGA